jgi:pyruvate-ferredoxin/flavodoxin oxidoreductase
MKDRIVDIVEEYWGDLYPALMKHVSETERQVENVLTLEAYYRTGHEDKQLQTALGSFAAQTVDVRSLSSVLKQGEDSRTMQKERYERIQSLAKDLAKLRTTLEKTPPKCTFMELGKGVDAILEGFESHIGALAKAFRTTRIADMEARARYDSAAHDAFFENFNWRQLEDAEMALCPPFVVFSESGGDFGDHLSELLRLVTSGKPIKVVVMQGRVDNGLQESGRAAALKGATDLELLFISLRNVYFAQGSAAGGTEIKEMMGGGLRSPRPGVFSVLTSETNSNEGDARAALALSSRGFPHLVYDPDKAGDFVSCLNLADNPELEAIWPAGELDYTSEEGEPQHLERPCTFADFALQEPHLKEQFTPLPPDAQEGNMVPIADFLASTPEQRRDHSPFVYSVDGEGHLIRLIPSRSIVAQTADKRHLWHTLQELGGTKNPFVQAAEQRTREALAAENEQSLSEQKAQLEAQLQAREQEAVAAAMKNLALRLTGMSVAGAALQPAPVVDIAPAVPASEAGGEASAQPTPAPAVEAPPPVVSELPWIDEKLCTTCDECIAINKKLFAYNAEKKAYITDPKAGPFKDIVRGAEKCSSGAIHPGIPQDPNEKDLDKWIKRAEKYQ